MISIKFKERYSKDFSQASKEAIKIYMKKNYVPRKEIEMIMRAWRCNTGGVKDMYEKILNGSFEIKLSFSSITKTVSRMLPRFLCCRML